MIERFEGEIYSALKNFGWLGLEIVIDGIPQHHDPVRLGQDSVVKFDLHVEDVRHPGTGHGGHVIRGPDSASDRNSAGYPCHVHPESPSQD
jgi:hypothetical protein